MDIKLFSDDNFQRIIIRNVAEEYNPLMLDISEVSDDKFGLQMVQELASRIDYNYVYKMNIVTIDVAK